ncbi:MAG TPA: serine/threonine-protein kinase [Candidatus Obscuribacterales bacterium]
MIPEQQENLRQKERRESQTVEETGVGDEPTSATDGEADFQLTPPDPSPRGMEGKLIEQKYLLGELCGRGGMSVVYSAKHILIGKTVAVKFLHQHLLASQTALMRFQQEAKAASCLNHRNCIRLYDFGIHDGNQPFIVMEYVTGESLSQMLEREGKLKVERAIEVFKQIAEGLDEAHRQGVIHRDLKPSNIILKRSDDGSDVVTIVDFGIAKILVGDAEDQVKLTQTGEVFGSPLYMSPEQCQGQHLDPRTDIYSFGVLMYESLTGKPPIAGSNPLEQLSRQIREIPRSAKTMNPGIPDALDYLVMRCLEKDPADRYQSVAELLVDLTLIGEKKQVKRINKKTAMRKAPIVIAMMAVIVLLVLVPACFLAWLNNVQTLNPVPSGVSIPSPSGPGLTGNADQDGATLDQLSLTYFQKGEYKKAIPLLEFGLARYRERTDWAGQALLADNLQNVGDCYLHLKEYAKALPYFEESMGIYSQGDPGAGMQNCVGNYKRVLAGMKREKEVNQLQENFEHFDKAAQAFKDKEYNRSLSELSPLVAAFRNSPGDKMLLANALLKEGMCYYRLARQEESLKYFREALQIYQQLNNTYAIANCAAWYHAALKRVPGHDKEKSIVSKLVTKKAK